MCKDNDDPELTTTELLLLLWSAFVQQGLVAILLLMHMNYAVFNKNSTWSTARTSSPFAKAKV